MREGNPPASKAGNTERSLRASSKDGPQIVRVDPAKSVSDETKALFIATLAASSNIRFAAETAGFDKATFYYHRNRDPAFSRAWDEAKAEAVESVEFEIVRRAQEALSGAPPRLAPGETALIPPLTFDQAIAVVRLFRGRDADPATRAGGGRSRKHWHWTPMDPDKAREIIIKNVETVRRARLGKKAGD